MEVRNIVAGLFERAKGYWARAVIGKVVVALLGFVVTAVPAIAEQVGIAILLFETLASMCFARAEYLKTAAEPLLAHLDFNAGLGWTIPKDIRDRVCADFGKFEQIGTRVRGSEPYFNPGDTTLGPARLRSNILESALYTRTLALDARNTILAILILLTTAFIAVLVSGSYHYMNGHGGGTATASSETAVRSFVIDALILLVTIDLIPLAIRYNALASEAQETRLALATTSDLSESAIIPSVVRYQVARTAAPLLPTFAFLRKRFPMAAIWSVPTDTTKRG